MEKLPKRITENGIDYVLAGDYYIPALRLTEESRPIGRWGRLHKAYLEEARPALYLSLLLSGNLWTYLADLNEQAQERLELIIIQMKAAEGVTEALKAIFKPTARWLVLLCFFLSFRVDFQPFSL